MGRSKGKKCCTPICCDACQDGVSTADLELQAVIEESEPDENNPFYNGTYPCDTVTFPGCDVNPFQECGGELDEYGPEYGSEEVEVRACCRRLGQTLPLMPFTYFGCPGSFWTATDEYGNYKDDYYKIEYLPCEGTFRPCVWGNIVSPVDDDGAPFFGAWWNLCFALIRLYTDEDVWTLGVGAYCGNMYDGTGGWQILDLGTKKIDCTAISWEFPKDDWTHFEGLTFGYCAFTTITVENVA